MQMINACRAGVRDFKEMRFLGVLIMGFLINQHLTFDGQHPKRRLGLVIKNISPP